MGEGEAGLHEAPSSNGQMETSNSPRSELKRDHCVVEDGTETEPFAKKVAKESSSGTESGPVYNKEKNEVHDAGVELCCTNMESQLANNFQFEPSVNNSTAKELSNDEPCSEVSNPNLSPRENASSFQTTSGGNIQAGCGEVTSTSPGNSSSTEEILSEDEGSKDIASTSSTIQFELEIPKHACTTGVRKITFKFSKHKTDQLNQLSASALQSLSNGIHDGHSQPKWGRDSEDALDAKVSAGALLTCFSEGHDRLTCSRNGQPKRTRKCISDSRPTNVKKLLSTRILDGARVKYVSISGRVELPGIIKDCGYLCGCSVCNYSKVLTAYEFEQHAGFKTRHPNNHIYLENGKPIYNIIQELKTASIDKLDEVVKNVAASSVNEQFLSLWKANFKQNRQLTADENYRVTPSAMHHSTSWQRSHFPISEVEQKRTTEGGTKKRDNDLHRLLFMPNGLPDGIDLAYYSKGKKILGGYKQGNGIVCSCCDTEISPSQFEAHAGWAAKRQPYRHIYTSSGLTLHDIALLLANGQKLSASNSDDMCAICGDGGELIVCDECPRAFHSVCLGLQSLPAGNWHCPHCKESFGPGRKFSEDSRPVVLRLTRVVKAPEFETGGCVVCRAQDFSVAKFDERTVLLCDQCEKEYHVGCLRESGLCNLNELPKDKWFCRDDCSRIYWSLQNLVLNGPEVVPVSVSSTLSRKHDDKGLTNEMHHIQWQILSGKSRCSQHLPLLSRAAAIFRECFDPIVATSGRDLIPVMVYGRNISGQEFGGMYCVVLIVNSVVVSAGLLRIFGREAAELPLVATSREHQGKGYFQALLSCIEMLLCSLNVENLVLPAAEDAQSIWTKKLGFVKMSDERLSKYTRDLQLTIFKKTSMLEKTLKVVAE